MAQCVKEIAIKTCHETDVKVKGENQLPKVVIVALQVCCGTHTHTHTHTNTPPTHTTMIIFKNNHPNWNKTLESECFQDANRTVERAEDPILDLLIRGGKTHNSFRKSPLLASVMVCICNSGILKAEAGGV